MNKLLISDGHDHSDISFFVLCLFLTGLTASFLYILFTPALDHVSLSIGFTKLEGLQYGFSDMEGNGMRDSMELCV